jgi:hypothetical protein
MHGDVNTMLGMENANWFSLGVVQVFISELGRLGKWIQVKIGDLNARHWTYPNILDPAYSDTQCTWISTMLYI